MSEVCEQYRQRGDRLRERRTRPRSGSAQEAFGELGLCASSLGLAQNPEPLNVACTSAACGRAPAAPRRPLVSLGFVLAA